MCSISIINSSELYPVRYDSDSIPTDEKLEKIARLYADVFADPPWNEYKICSNNHYFGREAEEMCLKCNTPLRLAYPKDETVRNIVKEILKTDGSLIVFENKEGEVYAAGWGFSCRILDFKNKYKTQEMQKIAEQALTDSLQGGDTFFYLSEVMVDKRARNQKIATRIAKMFFERANELGLNMVMRTHKESPMAIIAKNISMVRIIDDGEDSEIEGRVLYLKESSI